MNTFFPNSMSKVQHEPSDGKVIIVTRTKDRPILLARAFASVLSQTYQNWHISVVNDGGDPEPVDKLLNQYITSFKGRISVKHHPASMGMEAASNSALEGMEGEFVVIHDDDDAWQPDFLSETVEYLKKEENKKFAAVATNCTVVMEEIADNKVIEHERMTWGYWKERVDLLDQLRGNNFPPICLLIRMSVVKSIGGYNEFLPVLGDWDYNLRILLAGDIGTINKPLAYYHHRRPTSNTSGYGNSVIAGHNKHLDYQVLYRNGMLRTLLAKEPGYAGLIHLLLVRIESLENTLNNKLNAMHWDINHQDGLGHDDLRNQLIPLISTINKVLRPLRWGWRKLLPLRVQVARLRQRI
ncbi:glycosyltransferase family 2 protein [Pseudomonas nitroreducens]|uniref:glycosyltransferase family 2 protein n=1 Tax=Pseudomonas nitroreducens TaxID=46680 RepID=UPI002F351A6A